MDRAAVGLFIFGGGMLLMGLFWRLLLPHAPPEEPGPAASPFERFGYGRVRAMWVVVPIVLRVAFLALAVGTVLEAAHLLGW